VTRVALPVAALLLMSACATPDTSQPSAKMSDMFATPEWAKASQARSSTTRAITQNDLINQDGSCAAPASTDGAAPVATDADAALAGQGELPQVQGGAALGMTECEVVQRTGAPDTFNISAEGADRVATLTVTRGSNPGLYRFRGGRLVSIEQVAVPAQAKPTRPSKSKKTATTSQPPLRGAQR
jgi:hypothetical protein